MKKNFQPSTPPSVEDVVRRVLAEVLGRNAHEIQDHDQVRDVFGKDSLGAGTPGVVWPASGHNDPESIECGAWLFQPESEDDGAYYCARENFVAL